MRRRTCIIPFAIASAIVAVLYAVSFFRPFAEFVDLSKGRWSLCIAQGGRFGLLHFRPYTDVDDARLQSAREYREIFRRLALGNRLPLLSSTFTLRAIEPPGGRLERMNLTIFGLAPLAALGLQLVRRRYSIRRACREMVWPSLLSGGPARWRRWFHRALVVIVSCAALLPFAATGFICANGGWGRNLYDWNITSTNGRHDDNEVLVAFRNKHELGFLSITPREVVVFIATPVQTCARELRTTVLAGCTLTRWGRDRGGFSSPSSPLPMIREWRLQVPRSTFNFLIVAPLAYPLVAFCRGPLRRARWRPQGYCISCGYNLTGLTEPRCPECGAPATAHWQNAQPITASAPDSSA